MQERRKIFGLIGKIEKKSNDRSNVQKVDYLCLPVTSLSVPLPCCRNKFASTVVLIFNPSLFSGLTEVLRHVIQNLCTFFCFQLKNKAGISGFVNSLDILFLRSLYVKVQNKYRLSGDHKQKNSQDFS